MDEKFGGGREDDRVMSDLIIPGREEGSLT